MQRQEDLENINTEELRLWLLLPEYEKLRLALEKTLGKPVNLSEEAEKREKANA